MEVLKIKECDKKIYLPKEWFSIDEDVFVKRVEDDNFSLIAVYHLKSEDNKNSDGYYNVLLGNIDLSVVSDEKKQEALDVYDWKYDTQTEEVDCCGIIYDKEWSKYLLAEALINHTDEGTSDITECCSLTEVENKLKCIIYDLNDLANKYLNCGMEWLTNKYGDYCDKSTGVDIEEDSSIEDFRLDISRILESDTRVYKAWWQKEDYGYVLWIEFNAF